MAIDAAAKKAREDTVKIALAEMSKGQDEVVGSTTHHGIFDRGKIKAGDNTGKYLNPKKNNLNLGNRDDLGNNNAWCKFFITGIVMPQVNTSCGKIASGRLALAQGIEVTNSLDFPVPGVVWYGQPTGSADDKKDNVGSGHVGIVTSVDIKGKKIHTIEGNAGNEVTTRTYTFGYLKWRKNNGLPYNIKGKDGTIKQSIPTNNRKSFYKIWKESNDSLKEEATKLYGGPDVFKKAWDSAKEDSMGHKSGGNSNNTNTSSTASTSGTSSSEKQQFQTPYMTVAEATDYLNKLYNPQLKEQENVDTKGTLDKDAIPVA